MFAVKDGVLLTPAVDGRLLSGVTRTFLIEAADRVGVPVGLQHLAQVDTYDELYVSSTLKELTGIDSVDGRQVPGMGPVGTKVLDSFRTLVREHLT